MHLQLSSNEKSALKFPKEHSCVLLDVGTQTLLLTVFRHLMRLLLSLTNSLADVHVAVTKETNMSKVLLFYLKNWRTVI